MSIVFAGMTMSLDGFVCDRDGSVGRLYADLANWRETESGQETIARTGAVVMGRRAFEMGDPKDYADHYEFQVPIFVLTHEPPQQKPRENAQLTFTFVMDGIESAIAQAKTAAGDRDVVVVGGASTFQQCVRAGLADELHIDIRPVLLGGGLRLFEDSVESVGLDINKVMPLPERIGLQYRVRRPRD